MSKFNFGTPGATNASTPGFGFGTQPAAQPATGFGSTSFGATPAQPVGATTFGGTPTQAPPSFGAATAQSTGSTLFGSTPAQPAAATPAPSLNFSFGNNAAAPSTQAGTLTLGAAAASSGGLFGNTSLLGQPQQQQQQQQQQPQQQQQQQQQNTSISFGTPAAAKPAGLSFGLGSNTPNTGLGGTGTGLSFGTAATTTTGLSFGTSTATSTSGGLSFGAAPASGGLTFGTTSTAAPASTSTNFSFTAATPATTSTSLFGSNTGGLFGAKSTATASLTTSTTTTSTNRGLGGLDVSVTNKGLTQGSTTPTVAKENPLPNELMQTIDGFKEFVKTQKGLSSDVARGSSRPLNRCAEDTASLMELLTTLAGSVQRDRSLADKLKQDTARALQNAEIAQRTHDTPAGLQYENNAPLVFFLELAENFENDLMLFKSQIESTEKHIQTMMSPKTLTPQELTTAMSKLHDSLVAVAGKLQGVHSKVQQQKEQYLNIRKYVLKDCTNVFDDINSSNGKVNRTSFGKVTSGPTPFGPGTNRSFLSSTTMNTTQPPAYGTQNTLGLK